MTEGRLWSSQSVSAMFANIAYAGFVTHKGEVLPGRHEAVVSEELWRCNVAAARPSVALSR